MTIRCLSIDVQMFSVFSNGFQTYKKINRRTCDRYICGYCGVQNHKLSFSHFHTRFLKLIWTKNIWPDLTALHRYFRSTFTQRSFQCPSPSKSFSRANVSLAGSWDWILELQCIWKRTITKLLLLFFSTTFWSTSLWLLICYITTSATLICMWSDTGTLVFNAP